MKTIRSDASQKIDILNLTRDELREHILALGMERYRADQIFLFLHRHRVKSFDEISVLKKEARELLDSIFYIPRLKLKKSLKAEDGTTKFLFELHDGKSIESVLIPMRDSRYTICVSTQVGCRMGCLFCATGRMGFIRDLTASEIVLQVYSILDTTGLKSANVVYMGMGEPLDNYENVVRSLKILTDEMGHNLSKRKITLSTCGITPNIDRLKQDMPDINMALSLHSAIEEKRSIIMPINRKYPLSGVLKSLKDFPMPRRKRITFEYVMIKGFNDTDEDRKALLRLLSNYRSKLNIIPLNRHDLINTSYEPTPQSRIEEFANQLRKKGVFVTVRDSKGSSINAACGMLATSSRRVNMRKSDGKSIRNIQRL